MTDFISDVSEKSQSGTRLALFALIKERWHTHTDKEMEENGWSGICAFLKTIRNCGIPLRWAASKSLKICPGGVKRASRKAKTKNRSTCGRSGRRRLIIFLKGYHHTNFCSSNWSASLCNISTDCGTFLNENVVCRNCCRSRVCAYRVLGNNFMSA